MKKLKRSVDLPRNSVEAYYSCSCSGLCACYNGFSLSLGNSSGASSSRSVTGY